MKNAFIVVLAAVLLGTGCGNGEPPIRTFEVSLPPSGPVIVDGQPTKFIKVAEELQLRGALLTDRIHVTVTPDVPPPRKGALGMQLQKQGFTRVLYTIALPPEKQGQKAY